MDTTIFFFILVIFLSFFLLWKNSYFVFLYFLFKSPISLLPSLIELHSALPLSLRIIGADVVFCVIFQHSCRKAAI